MDTSHVLPTEEETKEKFIAYFTSGKGVIESRRSHQNELKMQENFSEVHLTNRRYNPTQRMVREWYDQWRKSNTQENNTNLTQEDGPPSVLNEDERNAIIIRRIAEMFLECSRMFSSPAELLNRLLVRPQNIHIRGSSDGPAAERPLRFNVSKKKRRLNLTPKIKNKGSISKKK